MGEPDKLTAREWVMLPFQLVALFVLCYWPAFVMLGGIGLLWWIFFPGEGGK